MIDKPIRYFLYARKSSENEDKQVASVPSQIEELKKLAQEKDINVTEIFTEEKSAKAPGRPVFSRMIEDIHKGRAEGILCWKLDRLARNPIDGGTISWMLQQSIIRHIQTFQRGYHPADNVLMMNLEFGMANQFVIDLSANTKRGQRAKIQDGWLPHKPPVGYANNYYNQPDKPPIYPDPYSFSFMKKLWGILLEKRCPVDTLFDIAQNMGFKEDRGIKLTRANFYRLFRNPFYYGAFLWNGELYQGKHEPMITKAEFNIAQDIISGRATTQAKRHAFAFTGLIRCAECGASITAEEKSRPLKNGGANYHTYYRCTRRIKRYVLSCLGSNLVLSGRKLRFQVDDCLALFEQVAPDVQSLHNRLEPTQTVDSHTDWEALYVQNKKWGPKLGGKSNLYFDRRDAVLKPTDFYQFTPESGESLLQNINALNKIQKPRSRALANNQEKIQLNSEHTAFQINYRASPLF